jgi:hypothetical protein
LWTRFNYFLTIEVALFGYLGYLTFDKNLAGPARFPIVLGIVVSALWYIVGAQDRALVEIYRDRASRAATAFASDPEGLFGYETDHAGAESGAQWYGPRSWYSPALSITKLPATIGFLLFAVWSVLFFTWSAIIAWMR